MLAKDMPLKQDAQEKARRYSAVIYNFLYEEYFSFEFPYAP